MSETKLPTRRSVMSALSSAAVAGTLGAREGDKMGQTTKVPWSTGTEPPKTPAPANATDCHHHIYDSRFPYDPKAVLKPGPATVADYRLYQNRIGTTRNVIVQPSTYGVDNSCLLNALRTFGKKNTRGIAVVNTSVNDAELKELDEAGTRGIRFNVQQAGATSFDMLGTLAKRIAPLGWHIQVNASSKQVMEITSALTSLPCPVVFDHFAHTTVLGRHDPAFAFIVGMLQGGKAWMKLSGAYIDAKPPAYPESVPTAQAYIKEAPERLVWGSDWPHPTAGETKPNDAVLFDLLTQWAPDEKMRHRILVENAAKLYHF